MAVGAWNRLWYIVDLFYDTWVEHEQLSLIIEVVGNSGVGGMIDEKAGVHNICIGGSVCKETEGGGSDREKGLGGSEGDASATKGASLNLHMDRTCKIGPGKGADATNLSSICICKMTPATVVCH